MGKSRIFGGDRYKAVELSIAELLNAQPYFLSAATASSTRATGDAIQVILGENLKSLLSDLCAEYSSEFARRAMADIAFSDVDGLHYLVDVKTHRLDTSFNMPNLTSVERLARLYDDDRNFFVLLMVKYRAEPGQVRVEKVHFVPIEFLDWSCLTVGALGWGQIQIANANRIAILEHNSRRRWMLQMCDVMLDFYPREVSKIESRMEYFARTKQRWQTREDV